jgi:hypothetical protein
MMMMNMTVMINVDDGDDDHMVGDDDDDGGGDDGDDDDGGCVDDHGGDDDVRCNDGGVYGDDVVGPRKFERRAAQPSPMHNIETQDMVSACASVFAESRCWLRSAPPIDMFGSRKVHAEVCTLHPPTHTPHTPGNAGTRGHEHCQEQGMLLASSASLKDTLKSEHVEDSATGATRACCGTTAHRCAHANEGGSTGKFNCHFRDCFGRAILLIPLRL